MASTSQKMTVTEMDGTITVTMSPDDFSLLNQQMEEAEPMQSTSMNIEEVVVKTEVLIDETEKPVLPQIPFSFPGQTFDTKCQKLILNVWDFFKRVKKNPDILDEIRTPQERAAAALHISAATIGKIGKNFKKTGKLETPGTQRKRSRPVVDSVNPADEDVIREIIADMKAQKNTPTLPSVLAEARVRLNFTGGATSFRRILARMGFRNLSQKSVVSKAKVVETGPQVVQYQAQSLPTTLKVIKQEPSQLSRIIPVSQGATILASAAAGSSSTSSSNTLQTANIIQISGAGGGQPIQISQDGTTILNPASLGNGQTFYIQQDNTMRPIQILYTHGMP